MGGWAHRRNIPGGAEPALLPLCSQHCSGKAIPVAAVYQLGSGPGAAEAAGLVANKSHERA